jgi:hypothetical protein
MRHKPDIQVTSRWRGFSTRGWDMYQCVGRRDERLDWPQTREDETHTLGLLVRRTIHYTPKLSEASKC